MGCGGSKQQGVAAGNTVTRRALHGSPSAAKGNEAAAAVVDSAEKAADPKDSSSEEYFSSRREVEGLDAVVAGTEVADDLYLAEQAAAAVSEKEGSTLAVLEKKKEEIAGNNEDDGKSIGNLSVDIKEAISMDEKEAEAPTTEKKITEVAMTTTEEIAKITNAEEKENSGENRTR